MRSAAECGEPGEEADRRAAIWRQLAHYPYHVGQMVMIGKMVCDADWQSLSIPRGNSEAFNAEKFAQEKRRQHFLDEKPK